MIMGSQVYDSTLGKGNKVQHFDHLPFEVSSKISAKIVGKLRFQIFCMIDRTSTQLIGRQRASFKE